MHSEYTVEGTPRRIQQLKKDGLLTPEQVTRLHQGRYMFINVWRSLDEKMPVAGFPLALCDAKSVAPKDMCLYELHFPDRIGENYSLTFNPHHQWFCYPKMTMDECLVFKVFDKEESGTRFVFHTAFNDSHTSSICCPRRSIEIRTIAFIDDV